MHNRGEKKNRLRASELAAPVELSAQNAHVQADGAHESSQGHKLSQDIESLGDAVSSTKICFDQDGRADAQITRLSDASDKMNAPSAQAKLRHTGDNKASAYGSVHASFEDESTSLDGPTSSLLPVDMCFPDDDERCITQPVDDALEQEPDAQHPHALEKQDCEISPDEVLVRGVVQKDRRTKRLALRVSTEDIAVIHHLDLDQTSAQALVDTGVRAVINCAQSVSGYYPNHGPQVLLDHKIPVLDNAGDELFDRLVEGSELIIGKDGRLISEGSLQGNATLLTPAMIDGQNTCAQRELDKRLDSFARNTLTYLETERNLLSADTWVPATEATIEGRHVLVVVRGASYQEDLNSLQGYIREMDPVLVAVDGGADALIEAGWTPDIIIGDMDSVSDDALRSGAQLIAHVYASKPSPALDRLNELGLVATPWSIKATSEDLALLLAYHSGADLIVAVGTHVSLVDYLDKGRGGMASTFLVRLKVGNRLVDAKGVSKLYRSSPAFTHIAALCAAAVFVIATIFLITPALRHSVGLALQLLFN